MTFFKPKSLQLCNGLIFLLLSSSAMAQPSSSGGSEPYNNQYANFSPSMAIIIVVLIAALFFMGFFSVYIRHCSDRSGGTARPNFSIRSRRAGAARGLDPEVIETFPTFAYSAVKGLKIGKGALECAVCLNEFQDDETLRLLPKCDHVFHPECIDAWLESHVTCPVCRANLVPQPGEPVHSPAEAQLADTETDLQTQMADIENQQNGEASIRVCEEQENPGAPAMIRSSSLSHARPPRSGSVRQLFGRFRSHSTGHSLVQPGQNMDRFTLRLPEDVRKQVIKRSLLNRTASCVVTVGESGSRTGYRTGEGSTRGRNYRKLERLETNREADRSDGWIFSIFSRASSIRSPKLTTENGEGSTSAKTPKGVVKMPSFKCLEPKGDETCLVSDDSARLPV